MTLEPLDHIGNRPEHDGPLLILSQDYELFFQKSGTVEQCLIKPTDLLLNFAKRNGIVVTFFIDAGMLSLMRRLARKISAIGKDLSRIKKHIETLQLAGHEIGLHVHPHWEDTRWSDGAWNFSGSRYHLGEFSLGEATEIVERYLNELNEICAGNVQSYRAGGFCIEPFGQVRDALLDNGISVDSSVIPGAVLKDRAKGFDFAHVNDSAWWAFQESPLLPDSSGEFLEIPVTPLVLPALHYWGRAFDRALRRQPIGILGDGLAKSLGFREIARRLACLDRVSELSTDSPKSEHLVSSQAVQHNRTIWHIMGHPKLLGGKSFENLQKLLDWKKFRYFCSVSGFADGIRAAEPYE